MDFLNTVNATILTRSALEERNDLFHGNHYRDGLGWIGPEPRTDDAVRDLAAEGIKKIFTSRNLFRKSCIRHRDTVVGQEVRWSVTSEAESVLTEEANDLLTDWWNDNRLHIELQKAVPPLLYATLDETITSSPLRFFYKRGRLRCTHVSPLSAGIAYDLDGLPLFGFYRYTNEADIPELEVSIYASDLNDELKEALSLYEVAEGNLVDALGRRIGNKLAYKEDDTIVIIFVEGAIKSAAAYPLGGLLTIYDMGREPLLSNNAIEIQKAYNLTQTMMVHNINVNGFLEEILLNVDIPGDWLKDGQIVPANTEGAQFFPATITRGPSTINSFSGKVSYDDKGNAQVANPQVVFRPPAPVTTFDDTLRLLEWAFYDEVSQTFTLMNDTGASGFKLVQAMNDYVASVAATASQLEYAVMWMLTVKLRFEAFLQGRVGKYDSLRIDANCHVSAVQPSTEERAQYIAEAKDGFRSKRGAMEGIGIDDPQAELDRIAEENEPPPDDPPNEPPTVPLTEEPAEAVA